MTRADLDGVRRALSRNPTFDGADRELVLSVYSALADGRPITVTSLANDLGRAADDVEGTLSRCNLEYERDEIVAFGGLSKRPTAHAFHIRGRTLYTWCAWDPLFIAPILGEDAKVESTCPVTGEPITLVAGSAGPRQVTPPTAVLSMLVPDEACTTDLVDNFCSSVLLFACEGAATNWASERAGSFVITPTEAFELGRMLVQQRSPSALDAQPTGTDEADR